MGSVLVPHAALSAALARRCLVRDLAALDVSAAVVDDAALVVTELVANAVRHGPAAADGAIRVDWDVADGLLRLEVSAGGPGPGSGLAVSPVGTSDAESGRGLGIVAALSTGWGVRPSASGNAVWAELPVRVLAPACQP